MSKVSLRKIIYITGTRADFGLMRLLLQKLNEDEQIALSLCVTGMHLSFLYGHTVDEIRANHLPICAELPLEVDQTTPLSMAQSIGQAIIGMSELLASEQPDLVLILGDRGEALAAAISAVHLNIPVVHLHGGERSGTVDEMIRHAISKLAHYHFVATEASKERLIKMGEQESQIHVVGAPGLDELKAQPLKSKASFLAHYHWSEHKKTALLIYHPIVQEYEQLQSQMRQVMEAALAQDLQIILLEPNSDAGGQLLREVLKSYENHPQVRLLKHLNRADFINCLAHVDVMLGNSSSGIIEAASFNLTVVNIGSRQNLRERSTNVIEADNSLESISGAIQEALHRGKQVYKNVYGTGTSSELCFQLLKTISLDPLILSKSNAY